MNSRWAALVAASLVAFASLVITWQVRQYNRGDNGQYPTLTQSFLLGKHLSGITNVVDRGWANIAASGTGWYFDLVLPTNARVFMTDMTGPTNYSKLGYYFFITYYLFPREIGVSVDQPTRMAYNEFLGRTSESDQEILAHGFDVRIDCTAGAQFHMTALRDLPLKFPANPAWFNSNHDTAIAFLLPLLTALAGMWLFRFLFPTLAVQLPLLEQLACGLGLGMMAVAALTLGVKLCGFSGRGMILCVTALGSLAEIWHQHKALWAKIVGGGWKMFKSPITIVILVAGLLVFLVLFRLAGLQGLVDGDAMRWMVKAKMIHLYRGRELVQWFSNPRLAHTHLDYPTLVPSLHSATYDSLGHVDEFVTKFWPAWMLLFLIAALASLNRAPVRTVPEPSKVGARPGVQRQPQHVKKLRGIRRAPTGQFYEAAAAGSRLSHAPGAVRAGAPPNRAGINWRHVSFFVLLGLLLLPITQKYVQWEGSTLPMIFFTVLGFVQCAFWLVEKDCARLGLGLTLLFGAAMSKFEGFIFLALVGGWLLLLPSARPPLKLLPRFWRSVAFCLLAAFPFVCLRLQIPTLNYESSWISHVVHHPATLFSTLSNWARLFQIELVRLFLNPDFANWNGEGGRLHWIGRWNGLSSLYNHSTLGLAWFCLLITVALWFAVPARRQVIVWILAMLVGATVVLSGVFVSFVSIQSLSEVIGYTNDDAGGRYLLPVLLAWFATIMTMFVTDPSSATTADRSFLLLKNGYWLVVGALLIVVLGVFVLPKNESSLPENPLPSAAAANSPNDSETNPPENSDLQTRTELAMRLEQAGKFAEALQAYREAVRLYPNDPHALNNLAWRLATYPRPELRNGREAVQLASRAVELTGQQQPVCVRTLAAAYAEDGQLGKAIEMAKQARTIALLMCHPEEAAINEQLLKQLYAAAAIGSTNEPPAGKDKGDLDGAIAYNNRGNVNQAKGDFDGAIADYSRAIELDPKYPHAYNNRGNIKQAKGDLDGAIADYNRALELDPKYTYAYNGRGNVKRAKGDLDGAIADYNRALELDPKYTYVYNGRGDVKQAKGDFDGAIADFDRALELDPKFTYAYNSRGFAKQAKGDLDGALADYNRALELDPKYTYAYRGRGFAKQAKGDLDGAIVDFDRALELDPKDTYAYRGRGLAKRAKGDLDGAIADFRAGSKLDYLYNAFFAWITLTEKGDPPGAKAELSAALDRRGKAGSNEWEMQLGGALLGQVPEEKLLALAQADQNRNEQGGRLCEAWYYLGMMKLLAGDRDAAASCFRKSLATERKDFIEYSEAQRELRKLAGKG